VRFEHWRDHAPPPGAPSRVERYVIDQRARPWSRRSPRAVRCGTWAVRFARLELELDNALFAPGVRIASSNRDMPPRCGAFADERRVVAGAGGGRVRTRSAHPVPSGSAASGCHKAGTRRIARLHVGALITTFRRAAPTRYGAFAAERRIVAGDEGRREY
jgi:hypothetical protein